MNFCTVSSASAAASMKSRVACAGTWIWPRSLPFTCTTSWIESCTRAAASTAGHGWSSSRVPGRSSAHSAVHTCGMMGESSRTASSSTSCATARATGLPSLRSA